LLTDASIVLAVLGAGFGIYRVATKICWACGYRMNRWRRACLHCGRKATRSRR
jgi:hypothetical protein